MAGWSWIGVCSINSVDCCRLCIISTPWREVLELFLLDKNRLMLFFPFVRLRDCKHCFHSPAILFVILYLLNVLPQQSDGGFECTLLTYRF